jgi:acyl-homoserine-lactone acylase
VNHLLRNRLPALAAALSATLLVACSDGNSTNKPVVPPAPELTYDAEVVWTDYGIPHVIAEDWGSLGYGYGYAYAQLNYCVVMKEYVRAAGESARYLGSEGDINADLIYKLFNDDERIKRIFIDAMPRYVLDLGEGYTAGLNRYLEETGVDNLPEGDEGCRGADWVRKVDIYDVARLLHKAVLRGSAGPLADFTVAARPQDGMAFKADRQTLALLLAAIDRDEFVAGMDMPTAERAGSNAYAVGEQASQSSTGILLGNPHFPWQGNLRWFMSHLTMGDEYDVMGATLAGLPLNTIGFNANVAWSHTVSTGARFTFYELQLNPDNVMEYIYDGEARPLEARTVQAEQRLAGGTVETVEHTFYFSHFGPIVDLGAVSPFLAGWPNIAGTLLTYRDANLDNLRGIEQWIKMGQSADLGAFKLALRSIGTPWVNTIAADRNGDAFYGDVSVVPHVSRAKYDNCIRGQLQTLLTDFGYVTLDGSDPDCEWGNDPDTAPGIFGYDKLPTLDTREYGANANDSYWLANPRQLLEGYSYLIGEERVEQNLRPRQTFVQAEQRLAGTDGLGAPGFNIDNIRELLYGARNLTAELIVDDVIDICAGVGDWSPYSDQGDTVVEACSVLADWDKRYLLDSVGSQIFYEFWAAFRTTEDIWAVPFDPADPVYTPRQLNTANDSVVAAVKQALADAVAVLSEAGIPMDRPWGEIQYSERNGTRYGIHGGSGAFMFSAIYSPLVPGEGYPNITAGNSYMQAVTWDESDCPVAYGVLSYSQSSDPASEHYADSTALYSRGGWIDMPFCEAERDAQEVRRERVQQ